MAKLQPLINHCKYMHFCSKFLYCFILKILLCAIMLGFRKSGHICEKLRFLQACKSSFN